MILQCLHLLFGQNLLDLLSRDFVQVFNASCEFQDTLAGDRSESREFLKDILLQCLVSGTSVESDCEAV